MTANAAHINSKQLSNMYMYNVLIICNHKAFFIKHFSLCFQGSCSHSGPPSFLEYYQSPRFPTGTRTPAQTYQTSHTQCE